MLAFLLLAALNSTPAQAGADVLCTFFEGAAADRRQLEDLLPAERMGQRSALLLDVLAAGRLDGRCARALRQDERALLLGTFVRLPADDWRVAIDAALQGGPSASARLTMVSILALAGDSRDLGRLASLAAPLARNTVAARHGFGAALKDISARDGDVLSRLSSYFSEIEPVLRGEVLELLEDIGGPGAREVLTRVLGADGNLDAMVLRALQHTSDQGGPSVPRHIRARVRMYLNAPDPLVVQVAMQTVALLRDDDAIERLLDLHAAEDPNLRRAALRALRQLTGLTLQDDVLLWRRWYMQEFMWWDERAVDARLALRNGEAAAAAAAIVELSRRRLFTTERVELLSLVLERDEPDLIVAACRLLGQIGSRMAVEPLRWLRTHSSERVRREVELALAQLPVATSAEDS